MNILITGGAGYIGSVLTRKLLKKGHKIIILDNFQFGKDPIKDIETDVQIINLDIRDIKEDFKEVFQGLDVIYHLAATSKEPTALYNNSYTIDTNYLATKKLAEMAKETKTRFIYASTCSVYFSYSLPKIPQTKKSYWKLNKELPLMKETDQINPISPYSITKRASEEYLMDLMDKEWKPIIFRKGTVYGLSPRMRFDLVVNSIVKTAFFDKKITVLKDIYRPLVDIQTATDAYCEAINLKTGGIYNIVDFNISLEDLAKKIADILPINPKIEVKKTKIERNYRADFSKMNETFYVLRRPFKEAVLEIWDFLKENPYDLPIYYNIEYKI